MSCFATEEAEILFEMTSAFFIGELAVFAKVGGEFRGPLQSTRGVQGVGLGVQVLLVIGRQVGVGSGTGFALVIWMIIHDLGGCLMLLQSTVPNNEH